MLGWWGALILIWEYRERASWPVGVGKPKVMSELGVGTSLEMIKQSWGHGAGEADFKQRGSKAQGGE